MSKAEVFNDREAAKPNWTLIFLSFGIFIAADDLTVVSTLLPQIIVDLEIPVPSGLDDAAWIVTAYLIANIVAMPFVGKLSDMVGRMEVYIGSLVLFMIGSIAVPVVDDLDWLIGFRVVQAIGSGAMIPVSMAIIGDVFQRSRRGVAMGVLGAVDTMGWVFGPLYGAFLVQNLNWKWQFYLNIPASLIAIISAYLVLHRLEFPKSKQKIDGIGSMLLTLGLIALNLGLSYLGGRASLGPSLQSDPVLNTTRKVMISLGVAAILLLIFWFVEKRVDNPIVNLEMFRRKNFSPAVIVNFLVGFALITAMVNVPLFINTILTRGSDINEIVRNAARDSGRLLAVMTGAMAVMSLVGGFLTKVWGYRIPTLLGLGLGVYGFYQMGHWPADVTHAAMGFDLVFVGMGFGFVMAPLSTAVINSVDMFERGIASSLSMVFRMVGMSVGLSFITAWSLKRFFTLSQEISVSEIALTLPEINAQIYNETFLFGSIALLIGLLPGFLIRKQTSSDRAPEISISTKSHQ